MNGYFTVLRIYQTVWAYLQDNKWPFGQDHSTWEDWRDRRKTWTTSVDRAGSNPLVADCFVCWTPTGVRYYAWMTGFQPYAKSKTRLARETERVLIWRKQRKKWPMTWLEFVTWYVACVKLETGLNGRMKQCQLTERVCWLIVPHVVPCSLSVSCTRDNTRPSCMLSFSVVHLHQTRMKTSNHTHPHCYEMLITYLIFQERDSSWLDFEVKWSEVKDTTRRKMAKTHFGNFEGYATLWNITVKNGTLRRMYTVSQKKHPRRF